MRGLPSLAPTTGRGSRFRLPVFLRRWLSIGAVVVSPGIALAQTDYSGGKFA
jgi:hypothetical protein